jgi:Tol biopolymer transport system component
MTHAIFALSLVTTSALAQASMGPSQETHLLSNVRQLIFEGARSGEGYFSKDGKKIIFQSERESGNPFYQIYALDLQTGDSTRVSPGHGKTTCAWFHPDGRRALFASTHDDKDALAKQKAELEMRASGKQRRYSWDYDENYDIYETTIGSNQYKNLTKALGYDAEGSYSPDGKWIVFASNRHAYTEKLSPEDQERLKNDQAYFIDLYLMKPDGTGLKRLTTSEGYDGGPFFSPDGKRIVWRRFTEDGKTAEVHTMKIDGTDVRKLTQLNQISWAPYYHPTGDYLIFATNIEGYNFELFLVDAKGERQPVRVTFSAGVDILPVFSPDGKRLAWSSTRTADKKAQLFMADWNDAAARDALANAPPRTEEHAKTADLSKTTPEIRAEDMALHIGTLASDAMEGRLTGTPGEERATQYVADAFKHAGLQPSVDGNGWFQAFPFTAGVSLGANNSLTIGSKAFSVDKDWRPLAFSKSGESSGEVVFAGYGMVTPAGGGLEAYDSYANLDVKDKWVLVLRGMPENITPQTRQHFAAYSPLRHKAMIARDKGARGIVVATGPNTQVKDELVAISLDAAIGGTSIAAISVTRAVGELLVENRLKVLQDALDGGTAQPGMLLKGQTLRARIDLRQEKRTGRNVLGWLRVGKEPTTEVVIIGAHVDHLGKGQTHNSLAREEEKDAPHHGADDNASGVAGLIEIAQNLVDMKAKGTALKRDVLFAAWSGEELGLLGSHYFVKTFNGATSEPASLRPRVAAYLNMDMIGRLDKSLILQGVGSSPAWPGEIERRNAPVGLPISTMNDSYLPTDATSFYIKGVPVLSAFTGAHSEYHTPRDTADRVNLDGAAKIATLMGLLTRAMAMADKAPEYVQMQKPEAGTHRGNVRVYVGTMPDYSQGDLKGVKVSGTAKGSPAEKAGIKGGDVIVEVAGKKIENIYDYTYALEALKVGEPVNVVVMRGAERVTLNVTPGSRE